MDNFQKLKLVFVEKQNQYLKNEVKLILISLKKK